MRRNLLFVCIIWLLHLTSCVPSKTCPAFQSYFILDEEARKEKFSKFDSDSIPRFAYGLQKNKFGIVKRVSYRKLQDEWNTIDMEIVMPSLDEELDSVLLAQELYNASDTLLNDEKQTPQSLRRKDHYNEDQLQYVRLFGKYLRKPVKNGELDASKELDDPSNNGELGKPAKKKGLFGFLKKNKKDEVTDDGEIKSDDSDFSENEDPENTDQPAGKKKMKKKKKKKQKKNKDIKNEIESGDDDISDIGIQ